MCKDKGAQLWKGTDMADAFDKREKLRLDATVPTISDYADVLDNGAVYKCVACTLVDMCDGKYLISVFEESTKKVLTFLIRTNHAPTKRFRMENGFPCKA